jgi:prepilin-type N-terminal cleavage/methylation domain-containing protein
MIFSAHCRNAARGFTLIELMIVLVIAAILIAVGAPALGEFMAEQHVRTAGSEIVGEIAFARAKAIESSRRVNLEKTGALWRDGWRIYIDQDGSGTYTPAGGDIELKRFDGFPPTARIYVCSTAADFATRMIFRPDGRIVRTPPVLPTDGLYVVDTMGDGDNCNNKIRGLLFGASGRVTTNAIRRTSAITPPCAELAPPCVSN